jgi:hypothetical protein
VNVVQDNAFSSVDTASWPALSPRDLPALLRDGLRDAYSGVLSGDIPDELAGCLARLKERDAARNQGTSRS